MCDRTRVCVRARTHQRKVHIVAVRRIQRGSINLVIKNQHCLLVSVHWCVCVCASKKNEIHLSV